MDMLDMAGHLIRRLHQQSTLVFAQRTQEAGFDLTPVQFAALEAICHHPARDQAFVAQRIAYDRATLGGVIQRLEAKGWVHRVVSDTDRRARVLTLTDEGLALLEQVRPMVRDLQAAILSPLNPAQRALFIELAQRVVLHAEGQGLGDESPATSD